MRLDPDTTRIARRAAGFLLGLGALTFTALAPVVAAGKQSYQVAGTYVETCSCAPPCGCELTGVEHGCQGVGAVGLTSGKYGAGDVSGTKIAYATAPGSWVCLYIDAPNADKRKAAEALGRAAFAAFGKIESVKDAKIAIAGKDGRYNVKVDGGKTMSFSMEPVLGGDGKTAVGYTNVKNPLTSSFYQAKSVTGTFKDGARSIKLSKGTNAFFNAQMKKSGTI